MNFSGVLGKYEILKYIKRKTLEIKPFSDEIISNNGLDLRIGSETAFFNGNVAKVHLDKTDATEIFSKKKNKKYVKLQPHTFTLLHTLEYVRFPKDVVGLCNLRSTLARWGIIAPPTIIDAGFEGNITIEIFNSTNAELYLPINSRFLHVILIKTKGAEVYRGSYFKQTGVRLPKNL
ncbi:MAG: dCTP deaminase [Candidatus Micrarchaeia archaeon]|jgi:dCTP deaminase